MAEDKKACIDCGEKDDLRKIVVKTIETPMCTPCWDKTNIEFVKNFKPGIFK